MTISVITGHFSGRPNQCQEGSFLLESKRILQNSDSLRIVSANENAFYIFEYGNLVDTSTKARISIIEESYVGGLSKKPFPEIVSVILNTCLDAIPNTKISNPII
jgi:hypothetical protein